ncbi:hypothetical protein [Caminibacter sp.]
MGIIILGSVAYFYFNPSYRLGLEARFYYETGNYKKAYELAKKAFMLNPYNRMAFTIEVQSKIAMQWQQFIDDFDNYFKQIKEIANKPYITKKDRMKIKIMLEILLDEYKLLKPSLLVSKELKEAAKIRYEKARELYEKLFGIRSEKIS